MTPDCRTGRPSSIARGPGPSRTFRVPWCNGARTGTWAIARAGTRMSARHGTPGTSIRHRERLAGCWRRPSGRRRPWEGLDETLGSASSDRRVAERCARRHREPTVERRATQAVARRPDELGGERLVTLPAGAATGSTTWSAAHWPRPTAVAAGARTTRRGQEVPLGSTPHGTIPGPERGGFGVTFDLVVPRAPTDGGPPPIARDEVAGMTQSTPLGTRAQGYTVTGVWAGRRVQRFPAARSRLLRVESTSALTDGKSANDVVRSIWSAVVTPRYDTIRKIVPAKTLTLPGAR